MPLPALISRIGSRARNRIERSPIGEAFTIFPPRVAIFLMTCDEIRAINSSIPGKFVFNISESIISSTVEPAPIWMYPLFSEISDIPSISEIN